METYMSSSHNNSFPTDIEKESLEAHVELCAQRYTAVKDNMERIETRLSKVENILNEIKDALSEKENQAYKKLLNIGWVIIGSLLSALFAIAMYLIKLPSAPIPPVH
jgi:uncharacterized membrane protein